MRAHATSVPVDYSVYWPDRGTEYDKDVTSNAASLPFGASAVGGSKFPSR